jgi:frataxin-like iron-binding protein CyaY
MRKYKFTFILLSIICFFPSISISQGSAIGSWRTHLPYNQVIDVVVVDDMVYAATSLSIFTYNKLDNRVDRFDKVRGLNDIGINKIGYNNNTHEFLVAYSNANLDIITSGDSIINITDIKEKEILGNKTINNIEFKDNYAYLSCGFGIVVLDMNKKEISDTYYIGPDGDAINVYSVTYNDTSLFAATESGIYYADIDGLNLADYHQWHKDMTLIHPSLPYNHVVSFNESIYINYYSQKYEGDTMFVFDGNSWDYFEKDNNFQHPQMNISGDNMLIVNRYQVGVYGSSMEFLFSVWKPNGQSITPLSADMDNEFVWVGDKSSGLVKTWNEGWAGEFIKPNGPGSNSVFQLDAGGNNVWVASGGRQSNWSKLYMKDGVFSFIDETWKTHNGWNTPAFDTISDYVCAKVDPANSNVAYIGTWQGGVAKFVNNEFSIIYNQSNSSLQPWVSNDQLINISGIEFDSHQNMWVANSGAPDMLSVMKKNGEWKSFNFGGSLSGQDIGELLIDHSNQKWMIKRNAGLLLVFTDKGTIDDTGDDDVEVLYSSAGLGNIPGNKVYSFATDHDGEVWVGTDKGIAVFYSPESIFIQGANYDAQQILVPRNDGSGLADYLLETELVTAIAVDGDNRKWIGTERAGIFLFSEDGLEQIEQFNTDNSPLLSNNITSISITEDGEVFIGTADGIISYKGTATPPQPQGTKVYAYPNPVRENYTGLIAIKGLESSSFIKITDSYGNLVYQTKSEGGQAVWDGNNFDGQHVATGIYMVFAVTEDKSEKVVTKILVVR